MHKILLLLSIMIISLSFGGCASVPMESIERNLALKEFTPPPQDQSGIYIYRNCFVGAGLKKTVYLDKEAIGETAEDVYFYVLTDPGSHVLSTESEFSNNDISIQTEGGENYFVEQYIKIGVFVGGANLCLVGEEQGKNGVSKCDLATGFGKNN